MVHVVRNRGLGKQSAQQCSRLTTIKRRSISCSLAVVLATLCVSCLSTDTCFSCTLGNDIITRRACGAAALGAEGLLDCIAASIATPPCTDALNGAEFINDRGDATAFAGVLC